MADALFIGEDYVKNNSTIDENVDVKEIIPSIKDCQIIYLEPVLGTQLYNGLKTRILASTTTANDDTLISSYIAPMLVKYVVFDLTTNLLFRYTNKNVSKKNSENSQPVDYTEYRNLLDIYKHKAEYLEQRLIDYLCANVTTFTEYNSIVNSNDIVPKSNAYSSPFYLGDDDKTCYERKYLFNG